MFHIIKKYLYQNETKQIIGILYDVYNTLGWGYKEKRLKKQLNMIFCKKDFIVLLKNTLQLTTKIKGLALINVIS